MTLSVFSNKLISSIFLQDESGTISTKELQGVMRSMGQNPTEDELLVLVMEVDVNGDGTIDFDEFLGMMKQKANEADQESDLMDAFKIFDRDKDGFIDMKELKSVSMRIGFQDILLVEFTGGHHAGVHAHQGGGGRVHEGG